MNGREEFEECVLDEIKEKITFKRCITNELSIAFLCLLSFAVSEGCTELWLLNILPIIFYPVFAIKSKKYYALGETLLILHNGVLAECISFIFALISIQIVFILYQGKVRNILVCIIISIYITIVLLYIFMYKRTKNEKGHINIVKKSKISPFASVGTILGITIVRALNSLDSQKVLELLCVLCFFLSCLLVTGISNIFKFYYLVEYNGKNAHYNKKRNNK